MMAHMRFDLEDGKPPVCFDLKTEEVERLTDFMNECNGALADAARYQELRRRFDRTKTSAAERVLADLGLPGDAVDPLDQIVDAAMRAEQQPNAHSAPD
jgi:hypothetical protein